MPGLLKYTLKNIKQFILYTEQGTAEGLLCN